MIRLNCVLKQISIDCLRKRDKNQIDCLEQPLHYVRFTRNVVHLCMCDVFFNLYI